jgi:histidine ammonia-lyase
MRHRVRAMIGVVSLVAVVFGAHTAGAAAYNPIVPRDAGKTVTLDGKHLAIDQLVSIARYGAKVQLTPAARQRSLNAYLLLLEGARENIPIYYFNRGTGAGRQEVIFSGDPLSPENKELISRNQRAAFAFGTSFGLGPRSTTRKSSAR